MIQKVDISKALNHRPVSHLDKPDLSPVHVTQSRRERNVIWPRQAETQLPPLATQREGQGALAWTHWEPDYDWSNLAPAGINNTNNPGTGQQVLVRRKFRCDKLS